MQGADTEDLILSARSIYDDVDSFDNVGHAIESAAAVLEAHYAVDRMGSQCAFCGSARNLTVLE